jgi:single-strand DNA-binding protein
VRFVTSLQKLARFGIATSETYRDHEGAKVTNTRWHAIVAWGRLADVAKKYLTKGSEAALEGRLISRTYIDKDGIKRYIAEIECNELLMLGKKA